MNAPLALPSPRAVALAGIPPGITATRITSREQWLSLRAHDVTASVAAALFGDGAHKYVSAYELWARARGLPIPGDNDKKRAKLFRRGNLMQAPILQLAIEDYPEWRFESADVYYSDARARIGASPDFFAIRPDIEGFGVVDGKSVGQWAYQKGWLDEDREVRLPVWIAFQVNIQAALAGASWAAVAALDMGEFELGMIDVPLKPLVMAKLRGLVRDFWRRVRENDPYPPDYNKDVALVSALYDPDDDAPLLENLTDDLEIAKLLDQREAFKAREKDGSAAERERKKLDAKLIKRLDNARGARLADGRCYTVKIVRKDAYPVAAHQYPLITVKQI